LALLNQFLHHAGDVFDRHVRVNPMLIEQINCFDLEPLKRAFDGLPDVLRPAVQTGRTEPRTAATEIESELGGNRHLLAEWGESLAHEFFVYERAIDLSGVEEGDPAFHGSPEKSGHLLFVFGRTVRKTHSHTAES